MPGVIAESSRKSTLSRNQLIISMLRKRSFVRHSGLELKNKDYFVVQLGCPIRLKGNNFMWQSLACSFGKILLATGQALERRMKH